MTKTDDGTHKCGDGSDEWMQKSLYCRGVPPTGSLACSIHQDLPSLHIYFNVLTAHKRDNITVVCVHSGQLSSPSTVCQGLLRDKDSSTPFHHRL